MAGAALIDVPGHWEDEVLRRVQARRNGSPSRFMVAKLQGSKNQIIRLPMRNPNLPSTRVDMVLRDMGVIAVGLDKLSIQEEVKARLPVLRGHPGTFFLGLLLALVAAVVLMVGRQHADEHQLQLTKLQDEVVRLQKRYLSGGRVALDALQARGYEDVAYLPESDEKVATSAAFEGVVVSESRNSAPFLLSQTEWQDIQRASFLSPREIPGYGPIKPVVSEKYRQRLIGWLAGERPGLTRLREAVRKMPRAVVEKQLRALAHGNTPDPSYISALLPKPFVYPGEAGSPYPGSGVCQAGTALCRVGAEKIVWWSAPAFIMDTQDEIRVVNHPDVARVFEQQDKLTAMQQLPSDSVLQQVAIALGILALACWLLYWHARRALKRYWRQSLAP